MVLTGTGETRQAVIYDFKTNALRAGETARAFAERMRTTYAPQMRSYRRALACLTNLAETKIKTVLLLTSTEELVEV